MDVILEPAGPVTSDALRRFVSRPIDEDKRFTSGLHGDRDFPLHIKTHQASRLQTHICSDTVGHDHVDRLLGMGLSLH